MKHQKDAKNVIFHVEIENEQFPSLMNSALVQKYPTVKNAIKVVYGMIKPFPNYNIIASNNNVSHVIVLVLNVRDMDLSIVMVIEMVMTICSANIT